MKNIYKNLNKESKLKLLETRLTTLNGILAHNKELTQNTLDEIDKVNEEIYELTFIGKPCNYNYYEIRAGECKWGDSSPHGDEYCVNPRCGHYLTGFR